MSQLLVLTCGECSACCRNQPTPPFVPLADWDDFQRDYPTLAGEIRDYIVSDRYDEHASCLWLTPEGKCKHHHIRPEVCREFEIGGEDCLRQREESE